MNPWRTRQVAACAGSLILHMVVLVSFYPPKNMATAPVPRSALLWVTSVTSVEADAPSMSAVERQQSSAVQRAVENAIGRDTSLATPPAAQPTAGIAQAVATATLPNAFVPALVVTTYIPTVGAPAGSLTECMNKNVSGETSSRCEQVKAPLEPVR